MLVGVALVVAGAVFSVFAPQGAEIVGAPVEPVPHVAPAPAAPLPVFAAAVAAAF